MGTFFILIVSSVAGSIGWWLGSYFGFTAAFSVSTIASFVGVYFGWKWNRELFL